MFSPITKDRTLCASTLALRKAIIHIVTPENLTIDTLIERLWIARKDGEWKPKTEALPLADVKQWMSSDGASFLNILSG